ncbi:MAG: class I SAM-dependent methyltransferase [Lentisphaerae bacterium]|nr:class I SAM-dependent methyltransferase [Lentisphaerota bacterium]
MQYLPTVSDEQLKTRLLDPDPEFLKQIFTNEYERVGIDRALMIAADLLVRTGKCRDYSLLDVGCNTGLIGRAIGALGNTVAGIDNYAVNSQQLYADLINVEKRDLLEYMQNTGTVWDVVLLLSVAHHWETGYAMSGNAMYTKEQINWIFDQLKERTSIGVYMEMPLNEPGFDPEFTDRFIQEYCGGFEVQEINRTVGTNGFLRRMFFLASASETRRPVWKKILRRVRLAASKALLIKLLRNAHLYEKMEMARLTVPRVYCPEKMQK